MRLTELMRHLPAPPIVVPQDANPDIVGLTADSRAVQPGYLFAALPGSKIDGARFMGEATQRGAIAALLGEAADIAGAHPATLIYDANPRRALALFAAGFYGVQPRRVVGVTGTSGKSSVAHFTREIWAHLGLKAASLGTLGLVAPAMTRTGSLTTPDAVALHRDLAELAKSGVDHLVLEASSHGLDQFRLDGISFAAAAFTNLSREHLDYHPTMAAYFDAKARLFAELLPVGGTAVINADAEQADALFAIAAKRGLRVIGFGRAGKELCLIESRATAHGQHIVLEAFGRRVEIELNLIGDFQVGNVLTALGLVLSENVDQEAALAALPQLRGAPGRLELVGTTGSGAAVYVDYAHKPDALQTVLQVMRPHTEGKLVVVFGCGGDRDRGKRPVMGEIAARLADQTIVTDDNPRSEDASAIRAAILQGAAGAKNVREVADRHAAIDQAVAGLQRGDVLLIAGKGHEQGQIVGDRTLPFDDAQVARAALNGKILWRAGEAATATGGALRGAADWRASGVSIDTRTLQRGDLFVALHGTNDGHNFVAAALQKGAAAALVDHRPSDVAANAALLEVADTQAALEALGQANRARSTARYVAVTGSVGKTSTKEALRHVLSAQAPTAASAASYNNHIGVPLTLARVPADARFAVIEIGTNHPGEIEPLARQTRPHVAVITTVAPVHLENFASVDDIAREKAAIMAGMSGGIVVLNRDNEHFARLVELAKHYGIERVISFGRHQDAEMRLLDSRQDAEGSQARVSYRGNEFSYRVGAPGEH
ncbi:MAG: UDP-N-acetylmuramoyl-L-alanyl-D-glutamate--2,6-diaminopimelate ligase, partial [Rhodospirillales bacterium]